MPIATDIHYNPIRDFTPSFALLIYSSLNDQLISVFGIKSENSQQSFVLSDQRDSWTKAKHGNIDFYPLLNLINPVPLCVSQPPLCVSQTVSQGPKHTDPLRYRGKHKKYTYTSLEHKTLNLIEMTPTRHPPEHEEYNVIMFLQPCLL